MDRRGQGDQMSTIYLDVPAPASRKLQALPLKYTEAAEIYGVRGVDDNVNVIIFGQPFSYEWAIERDGKIAEHSDCGYGIADVALIDGLTAYYKPSKPVAVSESVQTIAPPTRRDVLNEVYQRLHDMKNLQRASSWPHVEGVARAEKMVWDMIAECK